MANPKFMLRGFSIHDSTGDAQLMPFAARQRLATAAVKADLTCLR